MVLYIVMATKNGASRQRRMVSVWRAMLLDRLHTPTPTARTKVAHIHGRIWLWPYAVTAVYSYAHIQLWPYMRTWPHVVMARYSYGQAARRRAQDRAHGRYKVA